MPGTDFTELPFEGVVPIPPEVGDGTMSLFSLRHGMRVFVCRANVREGAHLPVIGPAGERALCGGFTLKGSAEVDVIGLDEPVAISPRHASLWLPEAQGARIRFGDAEALESFAFLLDPELLASLFDQEDLPPPLRRAVEGGAVNAFAASTRLAAGVRSAGRQILDNPFYGAARRFFVEAKLLEMLAYIVDELQRRHGMSAERPTFGRAERERIEEARDLLLADLHDPPSLVTLSRRTGLNQAKLKAGFRAVFGVSLAVCLREARMKRARELLLESEKPIDVVANEVGYNHASNFTSAFREHWGLTPGAMRRSRRS